MMEIWNNTQAHYIHELGRAYGECIISKEFLKVVTDICSKCENTGKHIKKVFFLYMISTIQKNIGIYFEDGAKCNYKRDQHKEGWLINCY